MYKRLRDLREDNDLRQRELAAYLQCTPNCYSHYEQGIRNIPIEVMVKLADYYGVSVDYLLGRTDVPTPYPAGKGR